jgi:hypothetical protein
LSNSYLFHAHRTEKSWRLVLDGAKPRPAEFDPGEWEFTRERTADDTNPDVRQACDEMGYCLFKIGASFTAFRADIAR